MRLLRSSPPYLRQEARDARVLVAVVNQHTHAVRLCLQPLQQRQTRRPSEVVHEAFSIVKAGGKVRGRRAKMYAVDTCTLQEHPPTYCMPRSAARAELP